MRIEFKRLLTWSLAAVVMSTSGGAAVCQQMRGTQKSRSGAGTSEMSLVVATVGRFRITRGDVAKRNVEIDPRLRGEYMSAHHPLWSPSAPFPWAEYTHDLFSRNTQPIEPVVEDMMIQDILEEACALRGIVVPDSEVKAWVHHDLDVRRRSAQLDAMSDEALVVHFGDSPVLLENAARRAILTRRLVRWNLEDGLGHKLGPGDFFRAHILGVTVSNAVSDGGARDLETAKTRVLDLRDSIVVGKRKFEDAADEVNPKSLLKQHGNLGSIVRTVLKPDLESQLLALSPGGVTEPYRSENGYVILRLDKRGADMTDAERAAALESYLRTPKRSVEAITRALKDIPWTTTIGKAPEWFRHPTVPMANNNQTAR